MFDNLTDRLDGAFQVLKGEHKITAGGSIASRKASDLITI